MILSRPADRQDQMPASPPPNRRMWRYAGAVVLACAGIIGLFAVAFPVQFKHQLDISLIRQPTPYTQLFLADPTAVPGELKVDRVNKFAFTVINDEGRSTTYHYTVTLSRGKSQKIVSEGSLTLGDSQSVTRTVGVEPTSRSTQYLVKVTLSGTADFIQFYGSTS